MHEAKVIPQVLCASSEKFQAHDCNRDFWTASLEGIEPVLDPDISIMSSTNSSIFYSTKLCR